VKGSPSEDWPSPRPGCGYRVWAYRTVWVAPSDPDQPFDATPPNDCHFNPARTRRAWLLTARDPVLGATAGRSDKDVCWPLLPPAASSGRLSCDTRRGDFPPTHRIAARHPMEGCLLRPQLRHRLLTPDRPHIARIRNESGQPYQLRSLPYTIPGGRCTPALQLRCSVPSRGVSPSG